VADYDDKPALEWRKSTRSDSGGCLEIALYGEKVLLRDSKRPDGPILSISPRSWHAFLKQVRSAFSLVAHFIGDTSDVCQGVLAPERGIS
jgi:hypothetical protein